MEDTISPKEAAALLASLYESSGRVWSDYGLPNADDCEAAILAVIDHLKTVEGSVAMELPNTGIKIDRNDDGHTLYFKVARIGDGDV